MGGTSGGGTAHSSEVTRRSTNHRVTSDEWTVLPPLVAPVVLLLASEQFLLHL
jgi:hypothetical protein